MQDDCHIFGSGKSGKMAMKYQHQGKDEENLTHFFGHYR